MPITGIGGKEFPRIGIIRKGAPKTAQGYVGKDLGRVFRVIFDDREVETQERFITAYGSLNPEEIDIIFTVDSPEEGNTWRYWLEAYDKGAMVLQTDGEWIRYLRDRTTGRAVVRNGRHVDTGERVEYDSGPAYSYINKKGKRVEIFPTPHGYLRVLVPVLRRLAYLELRTTSLYDCDNITKNLAAIAGVHGSLKGIPCVLRRQPIMVSKPIGNGKRFRDETWLVFIEAAPAWVDDKLNQLEAGAFSRPPQLESGEGNGYHCNVDSQTGEIIAADAEAEEGEIVADDEPPPEPALEPEPAFSTERPYDAETIKAKLLSRVTGWGFDNPATPKQAPFVARKFTEAFAPDKDATHKYHVSMMALAGVDSANDLAFGWAKALLDWLLGGNKPDSTGDTPLSEFAPAEAGNVYRQAIKDAGQIEMELEEGN